MAKLFSAGDTPFRQGVLAIVLLFVGAIAFSPMFLMKYRGYQFNAHPGQYLPAYTAVPQWDNPDLYFRRGALEFANQRYDTAVKNLDLTLEKQTLNLPALKMRAVSQVRLGNFKEALVDCSRIISLTPDDKRALMLRATLYARLEQPDRCADDLVRAGIPRIKVAESMKQLPDPKTISW
ncbi:MAG TPA: hypothetical protein V6C72_06005 [Chroococcales cyanobacterium]